MNGCRTCLTVIQPDNPIFYLGDIYMDPTNPSSDTIPIKDKLADCVPELLLDTASNTVICKPCVTSLMAAYDFRHRCLQVQQEIYGHAQEMPIKNEDIGQIAMDYKNQKVVAIQENLVDETRAFVAPKIKQNPNPNTEIKNSTDTLNLYDSTTSSINQELNMEKSYSKGTFECKTCNFKCGTSMLLKRHNRIHIEAYCKPCPKCQFRCKRDYDLSAHLKSKHKCSLIEALNLIGESSTLPQQKDVGKNKDSKSMRRRQRIKENKRLVAQMEPILVITPR